MLSASPQLERRRVAALLARAEHAVDPSTRASEALYRRAERTLVGGVASSFQRRSPWPIYLTRGHGAAVWDADGTRRLDFHNGFGAMVQGHAHPVIEQAIRGRAALGTHFAGPTEDAVAVSEELARRFGLPRWRFANSGSEATADAIRIARGVTRRHAVLKLAGGYHGTNDAVAGAAAVPFNDADALERRLAIDAPACLIIEPAMMLGLVMPAAGYLEAVRALTRRHGVVLIFDEVKTGLAIGPGGATARYGVMPDLVTVGKALGGGLPAAAIGGTDQAMAVVQDGSVLQAGTFNGNPLGMAAARASLEQVLTTAAYARLEQLTARMVAGCRDALARRGVPGHAGGIGARGFVTLAPEPIVDHATFVAQHDPELARLTWAAAMSRGLYLTPARPEQWTLSVAHTEADVDAYVGAFAELLAALTG